MLDPYLEWAAYSNGRNASLKIDIDGQRHCLKQTDSMGSKLVISRSSNALDTLLRTDAIDERLSHPAAFEPAGVHILGRTKWSRWSRQWLRAWIVIET